MSPRSVLGALLALAVTGATAAPAAAQRPAYPVTVKAANGSVTIERRPARIVVLSPSATETLFALGAGRQVVAVDDQSNFPVRAPRRKLSSFRPSAEAVARFRPDLVVTSTSANRLLPALRRLRIPVLLEPAATDIGSAYDQMRQLGTATGHRQAAARLVARMKRRIAAAVQTQPRSHQLSFFHELSPDLFSVTSRTFIGRVYALFGLRNIADAAARSDAFPQLSAEYVIAANPDLVFLSDTKCCGQSARTVAVRPGWANLAAVRTGRVIALNDDIASRWGPRIVDFVQRIAAVLGEVRG
jgi:iron complex transport system substrate-binding protein